MHLYALVTIAKRVQSMSANHLLAMQDLLNYLFLANSSLFSQIYHCIEMSEIAWVAESDDVLL